MVLVTGANWTLYSPAGDWVNLGPGADPDAARRRLARLMRRPAYRSLAAVRAGRVHAIWHPFYDNPYYFIALQRVAKWLHPGASPRWTLSRPFANCTRAFFPCRISPVIGPAWIPHHDTRPGGFFGSRGVRSRTRTLRRMTRRRIGVLTLLALLTIISFLLDLSIGQALYRPAQVIAALWRADAPAAVQVILWDIRLPVALSALVVGASLAMAGVRCRPC